MHLVSIILFHIYRYHSMHLVLYIQVFTSFPMRLIQLICSLHPVIFITVYVICISNYAFSSLCLFLNTLYSSLHSLHHISFYTSLYLNFIISTGWDFALAGYFGPGISPEIALIKTRILTENVYKVYIF
jgi:hypothetical protein